jgi:hypothetical protein
VKTSTAGAVKLSGPGLWTLKRFLNAGSCQVVMSMTNAGIATLHHHDRATLHATPTARKQTGAQTASFRLRKAPAA